MPTPPDLTPDDYRTLSPIPEPEMRRRPASAFARRRRRRLIAGAAAAVLVVAGGATGAALALGGDDSAAVDVASADGLGGLPGPLEAALEAAQSEAPETAETDTGGDYDVDDPNSITVVVNKLRPVQPIDWAPDDLVIPAGIENTNGQPVRAEAATAIENMHADALAAGLDFVIASGYRDYAYQQTLFDNYAASDGVEAAETYSARPGHSEHQLGLAIDLVECSGCALGEGFADTPVGQWAAEHAHEYGFILRYQQGEQPTVGYVYEPWHFRYVGVDVATAMHEAGEKNLETFLGLDPAPDYDEAAIAAETGGDGTADGAAATEDVPATDETTAPAN